MGIRMKIAAAMFVVVAGFIFSNILLIITADIADDLHDLEIASVSIMKEMYKLTDMTKDLIITDDSLEQSLDAWNTAIDDFDEELDRLVSHRAKRHLPEDVQAMLDKADINWEAIKLIFNAAREILNDLIDTQVPGITQKTGILRMQLLAVQKGMSGQFVFDLMRVQPKLTLVDKTSRDSIVKTLQELNVIIKEETAGTLDRNRLFSIVLTAVVVLGTTIFIFVFSRSFSRRFEIIGNPVRKIAARDLSVRTGDKAKDEIGALSRNLNESLSILSGFMADVHATTHKVDEFKETLSTETTQTAAALNEITKNIESIRERFAQLNKNIMASTEAIGGIAAQVGRQDDGIEDQSGAITDTSSAIEEMTASIGSVARLSRDRKEHAEELLGTIRQSGELIGTTNDHIRGISRDIDSMLEIIEIIDNVSEQTDILSMNAAIESAHAGEAGKGFAVVAGEIHKLAESTSENASNITRSLNSITQRIRAALDSSNAGYEAFERIDREITAFVEALVEISSSMDELNAGSRSILDATARISEVTAGIREGSAEMRSGSLEIEKAIRDSEGISAGIMNGIGEIEQGAKEILDSLVEISRIASESRDRMEELHNGVDSFITAAKT